MPGAFLHSTFIFLALKKASKNTGNRQDESKSGVVSSFSVEWVPVSLLGNSYTVSVRFFFFSCSLELDKSSQMMSSAAAELLFLPELPLNVREMSICTNCKWE